MLKDTDAKKRNQRRRAELLLERRRERKAVFVFPFLCSVWEQEGRRMRDENKKTSQ